MSKYTIDLQLEGKRQFWLLRRFVVYYPVRETHIQTLV